MRPSWSLSASLMSCSISSSVSWLLMFWWPWNDLTLTPVWPHCDLAVTLVSWLLMLDRTNLSSCPEMLPVLDLHVHDLGFISFDLGMISSRAPRCGLSSDDQTPGMLLEFLPRSLYSVSSWPSCWGTRESPQCRCLYARPASTTILCCVWPDSPDLPLLPTSEDGDADGMNEHRLAPLSSTSETSSEKGPKWQRDSYNK